MAISFLAPPLLNSVEGQSGGVGESGIKNQVDFIRSVNENSSTESFRKLIQLVGDEAEIPQPVLLPTPVTISAIATDRLAKVGKAPEVAELIIGTACESDTSAKTFGQLVSAVNLSNLSDLQAAKLQEVCLQRSNEYLTQLLHILADAPDPINEQFDLAITRGLESRTCMGFACRAIMNRDSRNLLWNERLITWCRSPIPGRISTAPDFLVPIDLRCFALGALRKNGFPSSHVTSFLDQFSPPEESELRWVHASAKYVILNDRDAFQAMLDAARVGKSRELASKVLSEMAEIPSDAMKPLLELSMLKNDLSSLRLAVKLIDQFSPEDFTEDEIENLSDILSRSRYRRIKFESWLNEKGHEVKRDGRSFGGTAR